MSLVNVRCGSYEWAIVVRTKTVNSRFLYFLPTDVCSDGYRSLSQPTVLSPKLARPPELLQETEHFTW